MPLTVFDIKGVPGTRGEGIEAAVPGGDGCFRQAVRNGSALMIAVPSHGGPSCDESVTVQPLSHALSPKARPEDARSCYSPSSERAC